MRQSVWKYREWLIVLGIALGAMLASMLQVQHWPGTPSFYQRAMGPAVMLACGFGLTNPDDRQIPELHVFLNPPYHVPHPPEIDAFDCGCLGQSPPTEPLTAYQTRHLYLVTAIGLCWSVFGVAWSALAPLYGLFYAISAVALYGLFRLFAGRSVAAICAVLLFTSPVQLDNLVRLRDYAKAPFLLAAFLLLGWMLTRKHGRGGLVACAALAGLILGAGYAFRMDTMIAVPAFAVCLLAFVPTRDGYQGLWRMAACAALVAVYLLSSLPAQLELGASQKFHHLIMGYSDIYDQRLGVGGPPYDVAHRYFDAEPLVIVQGHAGIETGEYRHYTQATETYEAMGQQYTRRLMTTFPADFVVRPLAAVLRTIDELGTTVHHPAPRSVDSRWMTNLYTAHAWIMQTLLRYARYFVAAALLLLAARDLRLGLAALFLLLYFGGYSAIQFASRNYFHLQFISLWAVVFVLVVAARQLVQLRHAEVRRAWLKHPGRYVPGLRTACLRALAFVALSVGGMALVLLALGVWQHVQVGKLIEAYESAPRAPLAWQARDFEDGVLIQGAEAPGRDAFPETGTERHFEMEILAADFDTSEGDVPVVALYDSNNSEGVITWSTTLPQSEGITRLYLPVYTARLEPGEDRPGIALHYRGLQLRAEHDDRLTALARLKDPKALPLHLTLTLPPDWEDRPRVLRLVR